jgi:hypothetical protein
VLHQARLVLRRQFAIDHITLQPEWLRKDLPERVIPVGEGGPRPSHLH